MSHPRRRARSDYPVCPRLSSTSASPPTATQRIEIGAHSAFMRSVQGKLFPESALAIDALDVDRRAIAPTGENAILVLAHVGDLDGQPNARARQQNRENQCSKDKHNA